MHAVAGAVDVAARDALVRLDEIEAPVLPRRARRARERPVAPQVADVERIDAQQPARAPAFAAAPERGARNGDDVRVLEQASGQGRRVGALIDARERKKSAACR